RPEIRDRGQEAGRRLSDTGARGCETASWFFEILRLTALRERTRGASSVLHESRPSTPQKLGDVATVACCQKSVTRRDRRSSRLRDACETGVEGRPSRRRTRRETLSLARLREEI